VDGRRRREIGINGGGSLRRPRPTQGCSAEEKICSGIGSLFYPTTVGCHFLLVRGLKTLEFPCTYNMESAGPPDCTTEPSSAVSKTEQR
jgi:hypothetical protein